MKTKWFKRIGWFHVPVSAPGIIVTILAALFCAQVFVAVDRHSHSASDTLYGVFPFVVCTSSCWTGSRDGRAKEEQLKQALQRLFRVTKSERFRHQASSLYKQRDFLSSALSAALRTSQQTRPPSRLSVSGTKSDSVR